MKKIKPPPNSPEPPFFQDILEHGYHIFSLEYAKIPGFYPEPCPHYPGVRTKDLRIGDVITIRIFFQAESGELIRADGGYIDLEVEHVADGAVTAVILTELPEEFTLGTGDALELFEEEILYKTESTEH